MTKLDTWLGHELRVLAAWMSLASRSHPEASAAHHCVTNYTTPYAITLSKCSVYGFWIKKPPFILFYLEIIKPSPRSALSRAPISKQATCLRAAVSFNYVCPRLEGEEAIHGVWVFVFGNARTHCSFYRSAYLLSTRISKLMADSVKTHGVHVYCLHKAVSIYLAGCLVHKGNGVRKLPSASAWIVGVANQQVSDL